MIDEKNREKALREGESPTRVSAEWPRCRGGALLPWRLSPIRCAGRLEEALALTTGRPSEVALDPLDDLSLDEDVREGMFLMQLKEAEEHARRMEMGFTTMSIGEDLLTEEHCESVRKARVDHYLVQNHEDEQVGASSPVKRLPGCLQHLKQQFLRGLVVSGHGEERSWGGSEGQGGLGV